MNGSLEFALGEILRLRKPHACGGAEWVVVRLGADIGLRCLTCKRRVLLPRRELERRVKAVVQRGGAPADGTGEAGPGR
jgi:hypothetical protein